MDAIRLESSQEITKRERKETFSLVSYKCPSAGPQNGVRYLTLIMNDSFNITKKIQSLNTPETASGFVQAKLGKTLQTFPGQRINMIIKDNL